MLLPLLINPYRIKKICAQIAVSRDRADIFVDSTDGTDGENRRKKMGYIPIRKEGAIMPYFVGGIITSIVASVIVEVYVKNNKTA